MIVLKCESQNSFNNNYCENQYNSPFDVLLHEITDAPPKTTKVKPSCRINKSLLPNSSMSMLSCISSLTSSTISRYVLSQFLSLLTRFCVIRYRYTDKKQGTILLLVDFSSAFDTINHNILGDLALGLGAYVCVTALLAKHWTG